MLEQNYILYNFALWIEYYCYKRREEIFMQIIPYSLNDYC
ncbi:hypothetical protein A1OE_280 [Candidatus Endolissoclinum faulkneri L2]|uniref:Uncharacterized protein n=1 Tax=Candidatus Endolissoclinum faulkneri L2 TaxID=1193729 RepID=K7YFW9_9PROT|nr:hypothetical protein A1OE_280 [Candidatus Endolissoclinum faulkneri L2]